MATASSDVKRQPQSGSVFFYILVGVVLFGALAFTITRGMRGSSSDGMTERKISLASGEIISMAQTFVRGVDQLRQTGLSEDDLCYDNGAASNASHEAYISAAACADDTKKLFHSRGAAVSAPYVDTAWLDQRFSEKDGYGEWIFSSENSVNGVGAQQDAAGELAVDVIAHLNYLKPAVCKNINKDLGLEDMPENMASFAMYKPARGAFIASGQIDAPLLKGQVSGCFKQADIYSFYIVMIDR